MPHPSRMLHVTIARPWRDVYAFMAEPRNLSQWAAGLGDRLRQEGDRWLVDTPTGPAEVRFARPNEYGVLDHEVRTPDGGTVPVPLRVSPNGDGAEVVFTLFRLPEMSEAEFTRDAEQVAADLARLRRLLEASDRPGPPPHAT